jgi:hypothetical protein
VLLGGKTHGFRKQKRHLKLLSRAITTEAFRGFTLSELLASCSASLSTNILEPQLLL